MTHSNYARPSAALVLTIRPEGTVVPGFEGSEPTMIPFAALRFLERLAGGDELPIADLAASVAADLNTDPAPLLAVIAELQDRQLLLPADQPPTPTFETAPPAEPYAGGRTDLVMLETPVVFRLTSGGFATEDHDGRTCLILDADEMAAAAQLRFAVPWDAGLIRSRKETGTMALTEARYNDLLGRLTAAGLLQVLDVDNPELTAQGLAGLVNDRDRQAREMLAAVIERRMAEADAAERERERVTGRHRIKVVPVAFNDQPPLALGLIFANAMAFDDGRLQEHYQFRADWVIDSPKIPALTTSPGVYMFSNYLWSTVRCREISELVKELSPSSVTIHGGPDTPKYQADVEAYFRDFPHVDITVRGEGEATSLAILDALVGAIGDGPPDLSVLRDVEGISYRDGDRVVHTPDRDRIVDLDSLPSPWLTGLFDAYGEVPRVQVTTETNRGCPYGCTFCDWGSATLSRIRKFDIERVFAEIEWLASHKIMAIGPADSNFGILERDVDIAEKIAECKAKYGYPKLFGVSYAKNTVRHLKRIIQLMVDADILTHGILSLQSMDADTLSVIKRTNIKLDKYEELASEFRRSELPLFVDLMVGLPGATFESFLTDLQQCVDREVQVRLPVTELLVNSPMNDPAYMAEHKIEVLEKPGRGKHSMVVSTATFTREDYHEMRQTRLVFLLCENFGILRQVARFVRQELGIREVDLYDRIRREARSRPERWPSLAVTVLAGPELMVPPVSWRRLMDEVHDFLVTEIGIEESSGLTTILTAQHALLPARDRAYPATVELEHDFAAWHQMLVEAKEAGHHTDWPTAAPRLSSFGPATLVVDDPSRMASMALGASIESHGFGTNWELVSPVARAFVVGENRAEQILSA